MTRKRVLVVAAVIRDDGGRILLARRPPDKHQGDLWEFPGGKVEAGEPESVALQRELEEELGITPMRSQPLIRIAHDYPDKSVELSVWEVTRFLGQDQVSGDTGREGQAIAWFSAEQLPGLDFPAANAAIVAAARLPALWRITPALPDLAAVRAWGEARLAFGIAADTSMAADGWLLRLPGWPEADYLRAAGELLVMTQGANIPVLLHGDVQRLDRLPAAAGLHLPAAAAAEADAGGLRRRLGERLLTVSAHDPQELARAAALGVDAAFLSPLHATPSHPGQPGLGWSQWRDWVRAATCPVYALGGMTPQDVDTARAAGGQGVAGISGF